MAFCSHGVHARSHSGYGTRNSMLSLSRLLRTPRKVPMHGESPGSRVLAHCVGIYVLLVAWVPCAR
jgi:hypothetical protein